MVADESDVTLRWDEDARCATVVAAGEWDISNEDLLRDMLRRAFLAASGGAAEGWQICVDLRGAGFVSSAVARDLLRLQRRADLQGGSARVLCREGGVSRMLEIVGLTPA